MPGIEGGQRQEKTLTKPGDVVLIHNFFIHSIFYSLHDSQRNVESFDEGIKPAVTCEKNSSNPETKKRRKTLPAVPS
jgi:hypothetical protein